MDYPAFDVLVFVLKIMQALLAKYTEPEDSIEAQTFLKKKLSTRFICLESYCGTRLCNVHILHFQEFPELPSLAVACLYL
jgi:hypothetical protein